MPRLLLTLWLMALVAATPAALHPGGRAAGGGIGHAVPTDLTDPPMIW